MPDPEGSELVDLNAAIQEAMRSLPALAADRMPNGHDVQSMAIVVRDESRTALYKAALSFSGTRL